MSRSGVQRDNANPFLLLILENAARKDACSIRHNVLNYSDDYQVMEFTIPAEYETVQLDE